MKGHMQDGKFHPHTDYKKGVRKSRDQKAKQDGVKIRKQRLTVASSPSNRKVATETIMENDTESLFKIKDVVAEPEMTKKIPSNLYVHITNMFEATGDSQFKDEPYVGEVLLIPQWKFIHPEIKKTLAHSTGESVESLGKGEYWASDIIIESGGIRLGADESGKNQDELKQRLADKAPAYAGMIGFFLDNAWNRVGSTGWDSLKYYTKNKDYFGGK